MREAPQTEINKVRQKEIDRVAAINVAAYQSLNKVRKYLNKVLPRLERLYSNKEEYNRNLAIIERYIMRQYGVMFKDFKGLIVDSINKSNVEQKALAELALGSSISWNATRIYKQIPQSNAFKITRRILDEKSVTVRSARAAKAISKSVTNSFKAGQSIQETQKNIDIVLGFRDRQGNVTQKALKALKEGKFAHSSGLFYDSYRIARTEVARASAVQSVNIASELQTKYDDVRLKLVEVMDSRTREQSRQMNGQISDSNFTFKFPDNRRYKRDGTNLPAKWSVNDRSSSIVIFLDDN